LHAPIDQEKLFEWYQHIKIQLKSGMKLREYLIENNLPVKQFVNFSTRVLHKQFTNPRDYGRSISFREKFIRSNLTNHNFCKANGLNGYYLHSILTHFSTWSRIEIEMIKRGIDPTQCEINPFNRVQDRELSMNFIKVKNVKSKSMSSIMRSASLPATGPAEHQPQGEFIKPKNDLEISISHGIKVILPHDTDTEKMLKVINFLKEL
jgi:GH15 family glucan-1,4-alpha-glucosidase